MFFLFLYRPEREMIASRWFYHTINTTTKQQRQTSNVRLPIRSLFSFLLLQINYPRNRVGERGSTEKSVRAHHKLYTLVYDEKKTAKLAFKNAFSV